MSEKNNVPDRPNSVPKTLAKGIQRQDEDSVEDVIAYSQDLIEYLNKTPDDLADEGEELVETEENDEENWTRVVKRIPCGKDCNGCPHGPYLYLVRRETIDKLEWQYVGPVSGDDEEDDMSIEGEDDKEEDDEDDEEDDNDVQAGVPLDDAHYPDQNEDDNDEDDDEEESDDWEDEEDIWIENDGE